jgi:uridine kinase
VTVLLIDGRSGSGKTELATAIVEAWPEAQLVRLDNIYPGWNGLETGSRYITDFVLDGPLRRWQRWDWAAGARAEWHDVDPERPIVVEGVGALSRANRERADYGIWVETDTSTRKRRAIARDGGMFAPHWDAWAAQEQVFIDREHPAQLADTIVFGHNVVVGAGRWRHIVEAASR